MASCPECDFDELDTEDIEEGDTVTCPECGRTLVLVGPDELDLVDEDEDEVLDDEDDEDDLEDGDEEEGGEGDYDD